MRPDIRVLREMGATALVDGGAKASPKLVCRHAMALAIQKAREHGIGWVSARASGEILTPFIEQAVGAGMVTMIMAQSIPTVAPHGGRCLCLAMHRWAGAYRQAHTHQSSSICR